MTAPVQPFRLYGRQVAHGGLTQNQKTCLDEWMPRLGLDEHGPQLDLTSILGARRPIWLEVGIGAGEHLLWQAAQNPNIGIIGVEPFVTGIAKCLQGIEAQGIRSVRLCMGDARRFIERLPDASISRAFVLHPDPWPKWRHAKRRIISRRFIGELARVLAPSAQLRVGTDWPDYSCWTLRHLLADPRFVWQAATARDWQVRPDDWPQTRYAAKAIKAGRRDVHFTFSRI
ncbi:MAG: tRNA (guanosine(46)-N7)-methyltransferase TrmB [Pseudomonadota bacterium]